jgi:hypothetical protein
LKAWSERSGSSRGFGGRPIFVFFDEGLETVMILVQTPIYHGSKSRIFVANHRENFLLHEKAKKSEPRI